MPKSEFPSFDDFLAGFKPEDYARWADRANEALSLTPVHFPINQENCNTFISAICSMSTQVTIAMLRDYHDWLCTELEKRSLRLIP